MLLRLHQPEHRGQQERIARRAKNLRRAVLIGLPLGQRPSEAEVTIAVAEDEAVGMTRLPPGDGGQTHRQRDDEHQHELLPCSPAHGRSLALPPVNSSTPPWDMNIRRENKQGMVTWECLAGQGKFDAN